MEWYEKAYWIAAIVGFAVFFMTISAPRGLGAVALLFYVAGAIVLALLAGLSMRVSSYLGDKTFSWNVYVVFVVLLLGSMGMRYHSLFQGVSFDALSFAWNTVLLSSPVLIGLVIYLVKTRHSKLLGLTTAVFLVIVSGGMVYGSMYQKPFEAAANQCLEAGTYNESCVVSEAVEHEEVRICEYVQMKDYNARRGFSHRCEQQILEKVARQGRCDSIEEDGVYQPWKCDLLVEGPTPTPCDDVPAGEKTACKSYAARQFQDPTLCPDKVCHREIWEQGHLSSSLNRTQQEQFELHSECHELRSNFDKYLHLTNNASTPLENNVSQFIVSARLSGSSYGLGREGPNSDGEYTHELTADFSDEEITEVEVRLRYDSDNAEMNRSTYPLDTGYYVFDALQVFENESLKVDDAKLEELFHRRESCAPCTENLNCQG